MNGKVKFKVPNTPRAAQDSGPLQTKMGPVADGKSAPDPNAKEKTVYLTGGHEMKWSMTDLHFILDKALKAAYKNKGISMPADQFAEKVRNEQKAIMDAAREAANLAKDSGVEQTPRDIMPTLDVKERSMK